MCNVLLLLTFSMWNNFKIVVYNRFVFAFASYNTTLVIRMKISFCFRIVAVLKQLTRIIRRRPKVLSHILYYITHTNRPILMALTIRLHMFFCARVGFRFTNAILLLLKNSGIWRKVVITPVNRQRNPRFPFTRFLNGNPRVSSSDDRKTTNDQWGNLFSHRARLCFSNTVLSIDDNIKKTN